MSNALAQSTQSMHQRNIPPELRGPIHEEAYPFVWNFWNPTFKSVDTCCGRALLIQLIPWVYDFVRKKYLVTSPCTPNIGQFIRIRTPSCTLPVVINKSCRVILMFPLYNTSSSSLSLVFLHCWWSGTTERHTSSLQLFLSLAIVVHSASLAGPVFYIITPLSFWTSLLLVPFSRPSNIIHQVLLVTAFLQGP